MDDELSIRDSIRRMEDDFRRMRNEQMDQWYARSLPMQAVDPSFLSTNSFGTISSLGAVSRGTQRDETKAALKVLEKVKKATVDIERKDPEPFSKKAKELHDLGLTDLANQAEAEANKRLKEMFIAEAGYKKIPREALTKFETELSNMWKKMVYTPLAKYTGVDGQSVPPQEVLDELKTARDTKLFDDYTVLSVQKVPDPILCGVIKESNDLYFIAEWGDDVKLSDIIK